MDLYRIAYTNGESDGLCFFYALDEDNARSQYEETRDEPILSITLMPGGFTSGGYTTSERIHLPKKQGNKQDLQRYCELVQ